MISKYYFNDLTNIPTLTQEEQLALIPKAKAGDDKAFHQLIEGNLKLVIYHAKKYGSYLPKDSAITIDDLISEGNIGLIESIQKFELGKGTHLSYYAGVNIKRHIVDLLIANANTIKIPYRKFKKLNDISKTINQMLQTTGDINQDALEELYSPAELEMFYSKPEMVQVDDGNNLFASDEDENALEMIEKLDFVLKYLKPRERKIITEYYGIGTSKRMLTDIAKELKISKGRASNIHVNVLNIIYNILIRND